MREDMNFHPIKRGFLDNIKKYKAFYIMLIPCIIYFIIFSYWSMTGNILAFRKFSFNSGMYGKDWVGLEYFIDFFTNRETPRLIINTLIISGIKLFIYLPFPIILALVFNEISNEKHRSFFQSISYLPYFISWLL